MAFSTFYDFSKEFDKNLKIQEFSEINQSFNFTQFICRFYFCFSILLATVAQQSRLKFTFPFRFEFFCLILILQLLEPLVT